MSLESPIQIPDNKPPVQSSVDAIKQAAIPIGVILAAVLIGSLSITPMWFSAGILAIGIGLPAAYLAWNNPEFVILGLIFLESDIILADQLLDLRIAGGGVDLRDLVLVGTVGLTFLKQLVDRTLKIPFFPIGGMLLLFLVMAVVSLANSLVFENVSFNWALNDFRILLYYTVFFAISWGITNKKQLNNLMIGLFAMANFVVVLMIIQQIIGIDWFIVPGMSRWQISLETGSTVRILPPLILMIGMLLVISYAYIYHAPDSRQRTLAVAQFGFLLIGLILTFTRSAWLTTTVAMILITGYMANRNRKAALYVGALLTPLMLSVLLVFATVPVSFFENLPLGGSLIARGLSIFDVEETANSDSLQWRVFENTEAVRSISERPIFGVGLGNQYREITIIQGEAAGHRTNDDITRMTRYIHNSFLSMAVKMGVPVLIFFLTLYGMFLVKAWNLHHLIDDPMQKSIVLGAMTLFIPCLFWAQFFSLYTESNHIISVAMFIGLVGVVAKINNKEKLI